MSTGTRHWTSRSGPPAPWPGARDGRQRVLRPVVLRIAAAELAPDLGVRRAPEAREVVGHLHRTLVRREELDHERHPPTAQARRGAEAEELLDACRDGG